MSGGRISLHEVSVFYGEVIGLSRVSLEMGPGITAIVGPNGSGKTTMMRALCGLLEPREGEVEVLGGDPFWEASVRAKVGLVPASECFFGELSGRRNLEVALLSRGLGRKEARERAQLALARAGLESDGERAYSTWSRGMRQRLKLGLALSVEAEVILLDEPFLGVDPPTRVRIRGLLEELGEEGKTLLVSSHVLHEMDALTQQVGILANGRLLGFGDVSELLRELRAQHPLEVCLELASPARLAKELVEAPGVISLSWGEEKLIVHTLEPEAFYASLPQSISESGAVVTRVVGDDESIESLFEVVTRAGARRLFTT